MPTIRRLVGVYDAEHTWRGELAYWIGARLGRRHCSLCDITHGLFTVKDEWIACRAGLPVAFDTYHLDDQPADVRSALGGRAPAVVAETEGGIVLLLDSAALEECGGSVTRLVTALETAVEAAGLSW